MTIAFDPSATTREELERAIERLGYRVEVVPERGIAQRGSSGSSEFRVPEDAPAFLREAASRARTAGRPLVVDFRAPWCAPCGKLERETLESPLVIPLLAEVEVVSVDLDAEPELGRFYGVSSIPHVLFVDGEGRVIDRLEGFEPAEPFRARLERALAPETGCNGNE